MDSVVTIAISAAQQAQVAFTKFITPNDTGATGGHQAGYHIHKSSWRLFFDKPGTKGSNEKRYIKILWQDDFTTESCFTYYGTGTRNEYRLTRFGKNFPYLEDDCVGDLLVICKISEEEYRAYVLEADEDIDEFFAALNISSVDTNGIVPKQFEQTAEAKLLECFGAFLKSLQIEFPNTLELARRARDCYNKAYGISNDQIKAHPDEEMLKWLSAEFQLFKVIENSRYSDRIKTPFTSVEELVETANTILNRRKSRAGKSLEHHLSEVFNAFKLPFITQAVTEDNKKPDFIFPSIEAYHNPNFDAKKLVMLASKTTCKDRWRQIIHEADRIEVKHLFTLQQSISKNQLEEMYKYGVCLVVPRPYLKSFPEEFRDRILTLDRFIGIVSA